MKGMKKVMACVLINLVFVSLIHAKEPSLLDLGYTRKSMYAVGKNGFFKNNLDLNRSCRHRLWEGSNFYGDNLTVDGDPYWTSKVGILDSPKNMKSKQFFIGLFDCYSDLIISIGKIKIKDKVKLRHCFMDIVNRRHAIEDEKEGQKMFNFVLKTNNSFTIFDLPGWGDKRGLYNKRTKIITGMSFATFSFLDYNKIPKDIERFECKL